MLLADSGKDVEQYATRQDDVRATLSTRQVLMMNLSGSQWQCCKFGFSEKHKYFFHNPSPYSTAVDPHGTSEPHSTAFSDKSAFTRDLKDSSHAATFG